MTNAQEFPPVVSLNVGGHRYTTTLSTLRKYEDSMLAVMFSGRHQVLTDKDGHYFIDRDGAFFSHILNFLLSEKLPPPDVGQQVYDEATFYGIEALSNQLLVYKDVAMAQRMQKWVSRHPQVTAIAVRMMACAVEKYHKNNDFHCTETQVRTTLDRGYTAEFCVGAVVGSYPCEVPIPKEFFKSKWKDTHGCISTDGPTDFSSPITVTDTDWIKGLLQHQFEKRGLSATLTTKICHCSKESRSISQHFKLSSLNGTIFVYCGKVAVNATFTWSK